MNFNIPKLEPGQDVRWDDNVEETGEGYGRLFLGSSGPCYKPWKFTEVQIFESAKLLVNSKHYIDGTAEEDEVVIGQRGMIGNPLAMCKPTIPRNKYVTIKNDVKNAILEKLKEKTKEDMKDSDSNYMFLAKLGKKRDWKSGCCVCLREKIMGTTCTCGHTEIVVFRPCGHTLCSAPCFQELVKDQVEVKQRVYDFNGRKYQIVGNAPDVDIKNTSFECPLCRVNVTSTFQAENVTPTNEDLGDLIKRDIGISKLLEKWQLE